MNTFRMNAVMAGALYILGTIGGVLSLVIAGDLVTGDDILTRIAADPSRLTLGAFFILVMGLSLAAMTIFLYPVFRKDSEALAMGMLIFRGPLEGTGYILSALSWLTLGALSKESITAGAEADSFQALVNVVLEVGDRNGDIMTFVFIIGAIFLYTLFYRTRLIPRWLSGWGLISTIPYVTVNLLRFFGIDPGLDILYIPLAIQEMVMGLWLIIKGFNQSAISSIFAE